MMKKVIVVLLIIAVVLIPVFALAHGGRTDSNGGHTNRDTGEYHYHHGYSAHQHPNGVCPYESKNTVAESYQATPSPTKTPEITYNIEPNKVAVATETPTRTATPEPHKEKNPKEENSDGLTYGIISLVIFAIGVIPLFFPKYRTSLTIKEWFLTILLICFSAAFAILGFTIF